MKLILSWEIITYMKDSEKTITGKWVGRAEALNIGLRVRGDGERKMPLSELVISFEC